MRGILAIIAGIAALTITSFAIEAVADPLMIRMFPHALPDRAAISQNLPTSMFLFVYSTLCMAFGGYVTAWLAYRSPIRYAVIMGLIQLALTVWAMTSLREQAPLRNWIIGMVLMVPAAWCGGLLRVRSSSR